MIGITQLLGRGDYVVHSLNHNTSHGTMTGCGYVLGSKRLFSTWTDRITCEDCLKSESYKKQVAKEITERLLRK